jgi:aspartate aminotransferase-like enzyme
VIDPGKVSGAVCFRIGTIGRIFPDDLRAQVRAIEMCCRDLLTPSRAPTGARQ